MKEQGILRIEYDEIFRNSIDGKEMCIRDRIMTRAGRELSIS